MKPPGHQEKCEEDPLRDKALAAFRRRHRRKRSTRRFGAALAVIVAATAVLRFAAPDEEDGPGPVVDVKAPALPGTVPDAPGIPPLTDEELLAALPEDSCFIATVDDRKILVFHDPDVRARFAR